MKAGWAGLFAAILGFAGCVHRPPPGPALVAHPHYELSPPYQAGGHWYYPSEDYALDTTGIAAIDVAAPGLTDDGEIRDQGALTAAMQAIQLPAIASVTNLANGRSIMVRVNDRGPADPARLIALSSRAALLLLVPAGGAPVRVAVDTGLSHRLIDQLGGGPVLPIRAAPAAAVTMEALPPPGAPGTSTPKPTPTSVTIGAPLPPPAGERVPDRMPEIIHAGAIYGGEYWLHAGTFGRYEYASRRAAMLAGLGGDVVRSHLGRQESYTVRAGPFRTIAEADAALRRALAAGIPDATLRYE